MNNSLIFCGVIPRHGRRLRFEFENDQRKLAFGQVLDHVYVRGLRQTKSSTSSVATSDHNPMTVHFTLLPQLTQ